MKMVKYAFILFILFLLQGIVHAQQKDSVVNKQDSVIRQSARADSVAVKDSVRKKKHDPSKASLYSAILPGAGQVYNKKYWKVPLVYTALGIPAYTFFYNKEWYHKTQYALAVANGSADNPDSLNAVDPKLRPLVEGGYTNSLRSYRDEFRKDMDYSILFFLLFWGINIIDATVDAHLKDFNVTDDLSFKIKPTFSPGVNTAGVSLVFDFHKPKTKLIDLRN